MSRRKPPPTEPLTLGPFPLHRFLSPDEIQSGIAEVVDVATREGIDIVLVGGVAMQVYGSNRLTGNIDFAATKVLSLPSLRVLPFGGIATETPSGIPVHVIVRNDDSERSSGTCSPARPCFVSAGCGWPRPSTWSRWRWPPIARSRRSI